MPISYEIDRGRKIVFAMADGILTPNDFFDYQRAVWSQPGLEGFDECVDMLAVTRIEEATVSNIQALAELAARSDDPALSTRLAIIAAEGLHFGLARMYEAYRSMQPKSSRQVAIFRSRNEALRWLSGERQTN